MKIKGIWIIELPILLSLHSDFYDKDCTLHNFEINDVSCDFLESEKYNALDRIKVEINRDMNDNIYPYYTKDVKGQWVCDDDKMREVILFSNKMENEVRLIVEDVLDGISKYSGATATRIHDGEDFITKHQIVFEPPILGIVGNRINGKGNWFVADDELNLAIEYATREKSHLDIAWKFLNESDYFLDMGKYEMSLINMAVMIEILVTTRLSSMLNESGYFKDSKLQKKHSRKSFVEKYFCFGLTSIGLDLPDEDLLESVDIIMKTRNKIMHKGKTLSEAFSDIGYIIEPKDLPFHIHGFHQDSEQIYEYFSKQ